MEQYKSLIHEYLLGLRMATRHALWPIKIVVGKIQTIVSPTFSCVDGDDTFIHQPSNNDTETLKLVGVGFGRTGTYSLKLALEELGYPTLHTNHMYEKPNILEMWTDLVFQPAIEKGKLSMGNPDFDVVTSHGFDAIVDLPTALYYKELNEKYPDCKFILTTRDDSEVWFRSFEAMITSADQATHVPGSNFFQYVRQLALYFRWLNAIVNKNVELLNIPVGMQIPLPDKEQAIATYENHNKGVRDLIPADRLLEYNVKDGWEPLCKFLDVSYCPTDPFPRTNTAASMKVVTESSAIVSYSMFMLILILLVASILKCKKKIAFCDQCPDSRKFPSRTILAKKVF